MYYLRNLILWLVFLLHQAVLAQMPGMTYVVETAMVKPTPKFSVERRYIGTIRAEKFSILSPKAFGTVASIDVKPGQKVKKGQLLLSLKGTVEKRGEELAQKSLRSLEIELERNRTLFKSQDITKSQLEKSEREVLAARAKLEEQRRLVENVEIRSPFDGVVGVPRVVLGESVQTNTSIITVMDGPYSVFINIPASRLAEIKVGQPVRLKMATTTIAAVEKSIDPITRTGFAKAIFDSCDGCIIGDSVYAYITVHEKSNAILINRNAIYYKNQKPHVVLVVKDPNGQDQALIKEITVGEEQENLIEVVSGLNNGDEIVIANPKRIPASASVSVLR